MPRQGAEFPWITESNYFWDRKTLLRGAIEDGTLAFSGPREIALPPLQRVEPALQDHEHLLSYILGVGIGEPAAPSRVHDEVELRPEQDFQRQHCPEVMLT